MPHLTEVSEHPPAVEYAAAYWKLLYELRVTALPTQAPLVRPAHSSMQTAAGPRLKSQAFMLGKTLDQAQGYQQMPAAVSWPGPTAPAGLPRRPVCPSQVHRLLLQVYIQDASCKGLLSMCAKFTARALCP